EVGGWMLPAGVKVYPAILLVQRREDLYPRAHEFRPERFLEGAPSYSWIPFGGGTRRCIGAALAQAEMAEVLRVVLARVALLPEPAAWAPPGSPHRPETAARSTARMSSPRRPCRMWRPWRRRTAVCRRARADASGA